MLFPGLALMIATGIMFLILNYVASIKVNEQLIIIVYIINLIFFLPAIGLHIHYYLNNRKLNLIIDTNLNHISFTDNSGNLKKYNISDIIHSEKNFNIYRKNEVDNNNRRMNPWQRYGYIKLRFKDETTIFITSLLTDIKSFPINCSETHYDIIPFLRVKDWETIVTK